MNAQPDEILGLDNLQRVLFEECETAGWDAAKLNTFPEEIAHLHEEVSEAFRAWRARKDFAIRIDYQGKPQGVPIEFADVLIGLFYNAELHGFDLIDAVRRKHEWNLLRNYPHEGRQCHPQDPEVACTNADPPTPS
jgi:NTP pyrophosphatase (non-canonical NTP hydrolase)